MASIQSLQSLSVEPVAFTLEGLYHWALEVGVGVGGLVPVGMSPGEGGVGRGGGS